jgi:enoyl reductase
MARAVVFREYGAPEVLTVADVPDPHAAAGQLRLRVRAAGVQPFDCATRRGDYAAYNALALPARLGNEVAGVVGRGG